jgi:hypothetical protein
MFDTYLYNNSYMFRNHHVRVDIYITIVLSQSVCVGRYMDHSFNILYVSHSLYYLGNENRPLTLNPFLRPSSCNVFHSCALTNIPPPSPKWFKLSLTEYVENQVPKNVLGVFEMGTS